MINDPELIKKIISQIESVPKNILDEAIMEVIEEDIYYNVLSELPQVSYRNEIFFNNNKLNAFELLHKNGTSYNSETILEGAA